MKSRGANNFLLALTAFIWGSAFVAQSVGMDYLGPFTFNSVRSLMGGAVLIPVILLMRRIRRREAGKSTYGIAAGERAVSEAAAGQAEKRTLLIGGVCCGVALAAGSSLQQIGLMYTSAGKAGFITALYIVIVPVIGLALGKKAGAGVWIGVVLAVAGMYFLCIKDGFSISRGDFYVLLCALAFSVHILVIDYFAPKVDGVSMSCIQFFVCGILCAVPMLVSERPQIHQLLDAWLPLVYAGVLSSGAAYTLQVVAQKNTDPAVASLILSLESVFSVITGWIVLGERLSGREMLGCILVFAAVILAQLKNPS